MFNNYPVSCGVCESIIFEGESCWYDKPYFICDKIDCLKEYVLYELNFR